MQAPLPPLDQRREEGRALRERLSPADQGRWALPALPRDPLAILSAAVRHRIPDLLPYRWGRMAQSPFYFLRGNAALMAFDVARAPVTGLTTQLCGDAHLLNLGAYAAPHGELVFDLNDFDEACHGPWEWDLKRLVTSIHLAALEAGHDRTGASGAVRAAAGAYREAMATFSELPVRDLARVDLDAQADPHPLGPVFEKARRDTPERLKEKALASPEAFRTKGPFLRPLTEAEAVPVWEALQAYLGSLPADRRQVTERYAPRAMGRRVSGCGSLGVFNVLVYCEGNGPADPLFLELKAQHGSAWGPYLAQPAAGARSVVEAQQRLQTWVDPFLGWGQGGAYDFLVKQWSDHKASLELGDLGGPALAAYAGLCGRVLAKGHARSGDPGRLAGYLGRSGALEEGLDRFATAYAAQVTQDWEQLRTAIHAGTVEARDPE